MTSDRTNGPSSDPKDDQPTLPPSIVPSEYATIAPPSPCRPDDSATLAPRNDEANMGQGRFHSIAANGEPVPAVPGYEILSELGRGGMGVVFKARQLGLDRLCALKMILSGGYAGSDERTRFRREAEAIARLQHPNIV
jgi:hypothetical protein